MLPRDSEFASKYCTNERVTFSVDNKHLAISYSTLTYDQYGRVPFTRYVATVGNDIPLVTWLGGHLPRNDVAAGGS